MDLTTDQQWISRLRGPKSEWGQIDGQIGTVNAGWDGKNAQLTTGTACIGGEN